MRNPLIDIRDDTTGETIASRVHLSDAMPDAGDERGDALARLRTDSVVMVGGGASPLFSIVLSGRLQ